jgi:queuine/archaeosine tRNA-ribosyltransferase
MLKNKGLHRRSEFKHPSGLTLKTPLLIPSFSSRGLNLRIKKNKLVSELSLIVDLASEIIDKTMLVSAFDIHHRFIKKKDLRVPEILFVDSGGYEAAVYYDFLEMRKWERNMYKDILDKWDNKYTPSIFISFDHDYSGLPVKKQIDSEIEFLSKYRRHHMVEMLLKPEKKDIYLNIDSIIRNINNLDQFNIIGVTEKELGATFLDRLKAVAIIRSQLDKVGNKTPIHIFGCLEPFLIILYFFAGAEIFDGLSWLRYGYFNGMTIYNKEFGISEFNINMNFDRMKIMVLRQNLYYLSNLALEMRKFTVSNDYKVFGGNYKKIEEIHKTLFSELRGVL